MINRQNWHDTSAYLEHLDRTQQLSDSSVRRVRTHLRHLIEWADESMLPEARAIDPTFPVYLLKARIDYLKDKPLSPSSIVKCLQVARRFLVFARAEWPQRY